MQLVIKQAVDSADFAICMAIRMEVFVFEQEVPAEEEWDSYDRDATHFLVRADGAPAATARLRVVNGGAKIERMAVRDGFRRQHVGEELVAFVMQHAREQGLTRAALSAQTHAVPFYEKLGFVTQGDEYQEAGIPHKMMVREL